MYTSQRITARCSSGSNSPRMQTKPPSIAFTDRFCGFFDPSFDRFAA
ncbi:MAG TPA: hypothetical protein PLI52_01155 [Prochlorococcaceae cyanobacterium AMR_MDS_5431]|nr:hypothetical protein [Prochlorococcaceae cyanobacterium AMR_MDS_5431]